MQNEKLPQLFQITNDEYEVNKICVSANNRKLFYN